MQREYTIAVPLLKDGLTNYLILEYKGEEYKRFYYLLEHLFKTINITKYQIYQGKYEETIQVFIEVCSLALQEADTRLLKISNTLKQKLAKKWKCLPSSSLPEEYNIITLPYKKLL